MFRTSFGAAIMLALIVAAGPALAHIRLDVPKNRYEDQKNGPCGAPDDQRTDRVTVYAPGETITVEWEETIKHPSHFRIAFSANGTDDFEDPADFDDVYTNGAVLLDDIPDREEAGFYRAEVTLPEIECEDCTLQLMQIMYDRATYGPHALYWQCADLVLRAGGGDRDPGPDSDPDPDPDASGGGCATASPPGGFAALVIAAALAAGYAPRRRSARAG